MNVLKTLWRILSGISKVISVLVPLILIGVFITAFSVSLSESVPEPLPERAGLLLAPQGRLVENRTPLRPVDALFADDVSNEVLLSSVIDAIDAAAHSLFGKHGCLSWVVGIYHCYAMDFSYCI